MFKEDVEKDGHQGRSPELGFSIARVDPRVDSRVDSGHFWLGSAFLRAKLGPTKSRINPPIA